MRVRVRSRLLGGVRARVRFRLLAVVLVLAAALGLSACGGSSSTPQATLHAFLSAWQARDWTAMERQVLDPPADFATVNAQLFTGLDTTSVRLSAGRVTKHGSRASAPVTERFSLAVVGAWNPVTHVALTEHKGRWLVAWTPATINPGLTEPGERIVLSRHWPARAAILGAGGAPLVTNASQVSVGVVGQRIKNAHAVSADLLAAGAPAPAVSQALALARAHPADFEPVFTISQGRFNQLKAQAGPNNVYAVPGTQFELASARRAITAQLGAHLVGSVGPITAQQLQQLGSPYDATSDVGETGLEASYERQLAGAPSTHIDVTDATGTPVNRLATWPGHPGRPVDTSLDPRVQRAAEAALAPEHRNVAMVAIRASTGQVLAAVSDPLNSFDEAFQGAYPPGSTFKVLTSTALIGAGLTPASPTSCPTTTVVDGETFHNAEGDGQAPNLQAAFTESCNTAFIDMTLAHLRPSDFTAVARLYGLQRRPLLGVPAFDANVPPPNGRTALAATAIGQAQVTFSPLGMATVAAAVDSGVVHAPRLVVGAPDDRVPTGSVPAGALGDLRSMMASVVTSGTAAGTGLPAGTHAKTGTAEYGSGGTLKIDGWLMGYNGDIAFAIVVQNTGGVDGGPLDGPIIARFFHALGQ